jgi:hypothetical protein
VAYGTHSATLAAGLTAFAITDDHAKQEAVWAESPDYNNEREAILAALTGEQIAADDRRAVFVGAEAYACINGEHRSVAVAVGHDKRHRSTSNGRPPTDTTPQPAH